MYRKTLALLLSVLMVLSVVIALPASAAEATSAKKVLWARDFTQVTKEEAANKNYYTDNEVFGQYTYGWDGATTSGIEIYDSGSSMAYANGLIGIRTGDTIFRTTTDSPSKGTDVGNNDFYKLLNGFYSDSSYTQKVKGNKVFFEFDFVWFKLPDQASLHAANGGYKDANGNTVSATLYSDYAGDSQKGRLFIMNGGHGNLEPLIYLGGNGLDKGYVYAESNMTTSGYTTVPTDDSVYYKDANGEKVYLKAGTQLTGTKSGEGAKFLPKDPSAVYEIDYKTRYRFGIEIEIASVAADGQVNMIATVYIKHDGAETWEACIGSTNYYSRPYDGSYTGGSNCKPEYEKITLGYSDSTGYKKLGGDMEIYTYSCNGTDHLNVVENKSGTNVSCTCIDCGETWTEREADGIRYIGEVVGNACEGSYMLWTPKNGIGAPFVERLTEGSGHSYDANGKCSACGMYEYIKCPVEWSPSFSKSTTSNTAISTAAPSYNAETGKVEAPTGGTVTVTTNMANGSNYAALYAPITVSFDLTVNDVLLNDTSKDAPFPLLNFVGNNSASTTEELLALGALEENADTVEVMFFQMNDRASSRTYGWAGCVERSSIYTMKLGETYSFFLLVDPVTLRESVYINGEYVGSAVLDKIATSLTQEYQFRFGQNTVGSPYFFNYSLDNIDATLHSTIEAAYAAIPTNQIFSLRYDRWQTGHNVSGNRPTLFQGATPYFGGGENVLPASYKAGDDGSVYATMSDSGAERKISLSTTSGDTRFDLSDKKYEIRVNFALDSATTLSGAGNLVNVYRSTDPSVRWALVSFNADGTYAAHKGNLYDKNGNRLTFMRTVTDGVPESTSDLRVIVDEANGTYSIYVDGAIAYFRNGNRFDPFLNRPLSGAKTFTDDKARTCDYLQLFQGKIPAVLKEASITLIPDSDIEFIGSQSRNSDRGAASGTFDLRFVFGVDDLYMSDAGFRVTAYKNGEQVGEEQNVALSAVYSALNSNGGKLHAYACPEGQYLAAFKIVGIEETNGEDTYLFEITPYANGVDGETYEIECDGLGQIKKLNLGVDQAPETPEVILELTESVGGELSTFYVYTRCADPSGRYYVRYAFSYEHSTAVTNGADSTTNISAFRIKGAHLVQLSGISDAAVSYQPIVRVLGDGEISLAIKESRSDYTVQDFIGGFHGDEHVTDFSLLADGVSYTPGAEGKKVVACSELVIHQTSELDRWEEGLGADGKKEQVLEHDQVFTVDGNGIRAHRTLTWLVSDFTINAAYPMMFTLQRVTDSTETAPVCEIVDIYDAYGARLGGAVTDLSYAKQLNHLSYASGREARYSSATSGISAKAGVKNLSGVSVAETFIASRPKLDNKWYVRMVSAENGNKPVSGETWSLTCYYHIDYTTPDTQK